MELFAIAALVLLGAILTAVKMGLSEVVKGLQAIYDKLDERD